MKLSGSAKHLHFPCLAFPHCRQKVGFNPLLPWVWQGVHLLRALQLEPVQVLLGNWFMLGSSFDVAPILEGDFWGWVLEGEGLCVAWHR